MSAVPMETLEVESSQLVTGPKQLLERLFALKLPPQPRPLMCHAWLDANRRLVSIDIGEDWPSPSGASAATYLVQVLLLSANASEAERLKQVRDLRDNPMSDGCHTLDRLLVRGDRWWSALCGDANCCPTGGRPIANRLRLSDSERRSAWKQLQTARDELPAGGIPFEVTGLLVDRPLRDCILADLGHQPDRRGDWQRLLSMTESVSGPADAAVATVQAAISYLESDRTAAANHLRRAREHDPEYSLAGLLQQGLDLGADADLALSAFCAYTCEELLALAASGDVGEAGSAAPANITAKTK